MTKTKRRMNVDDLSSLVSDLMDQTKVLVAAVDDLRCEVEWWARNAAEERASHPSSAAWHAVQDAGHEKLLEADAEPPPAPSADSRVSSTADVPVPETAAEVIVARPLSAAVEASAAERLATLERVLASGRRGAWPEEWDGDDAPEFPVGEVISVDTNLWECALDRRPAHVVGRGCCCEEGIGAPYLLAWQNEDGCFFRELSEEESSDLQRACLVAQSVRVRSSSTGLTALTDPIGALARVIFRRG